MANTFFGLTIGSSGLFASNAAINTTAHNISNINTKGYTKQVSNQQAAESIRVYQSYGTVGTGTAVVSIDQLRSSYYDTKYRQANTNCSQYGSLQNYTTLVEDYLDEFNLNGFTKEYQNLFSAINDLQRDPTSAVGRNQFLNYAQSICDYFNTLSTNFSIVQRQANDEVKTTVNSINTISEQIVSLNKQINVIEINGGHLRDQRALLVDELSGYINTTVSEKEIGNGATEFKVYVNGQELVDMYNCNKLLLETRETGKRRNASDLDGLYDITWNNGLGFNMYSSSLTGSLKAAIDVRDGCNEAYEVLGMADKDGNYLKDADGKIINVQDITEAEYNGYVAAGYSKKMVTVGETRFNSSYKGIPYYQEEINKFIQKISDVFNETISGGNKRVTDKPVEDLFVSRYGDSYITAGNVAINQEILNDVSKLPYSYDSTKGSANVDMVEELLAIKNKIVINNGNFESFLNSIVSVCSIDAGRVKTFQATYSNIKETIDNQRMSVSGVDEDEEGIDLVKFKKAYNLSSKVISVMQEIYDKLIEQTGV
jgi:flagellar hook-associated protein 1 FlgK